MPHVFSNPRLFPALLAGLLAILGTAPVSGETNAGAVRTLRGTGLYEPAAYGIRQPLMVPGKPGPAQRQSLLFPVEGPGGRTGPVANPGWPGQQPFIACTTNVVLNSGTPYTGNTSTYTNNMPSYTGVPWDESGKEVVHEITTYEVTDLRVYLDVADPVNVDLDVFLLQPCNSTNTVAAADVGFIYEDLPAGTYYVVVDGYQGSEGAYTLTVAAATGILLVDDDGSGDVLQNHPDVRSSYYNALTARGYTPFVWDVASLGSPDEGTLNNSLVVIWFTGGAYQDGLTISASDQNNLAGYLNSGGRLLLVGQDILYDVMNGQSGRVPDGNFFNDFLQVTTVTQDIGSPGNTLAGAAGDPVGDDNNSGTGTQALSLGMSPFNPFSDAVFSRYGEYSYYTNDRRAASVRFDSGFSKSLFLPFCPELTASATVMEDLLDRAVIWLSDNSYCIGYHPQANPTGLDVWMGFTGDANGYPDPGDTMTAAVSVKNYDSVAHNVYIYMYGLDPNTTAGVTYRSFGSVAAGATATQNFTFTVSAGCRVGYELRLRFNVYDNSALCFPMTVGSFVGQAQVLLVKDELFFPNTTGQDIYEGILDGLGYTYATWETALFGGPSYNTYGLSNDFMQNYGYVIWFTGADPIYTLEAADETELTTLLSNGKRLILSGQDILYDLYGVSGSPPVGSFARNYLTVNSFTDDSVFRTSDALVGPPGTWPSEYMSLLLSDGETFVNAADAVITLGSTMFSYNTQGGIAGVGRWAKTDAYKVFFMPFAFENITDASPPSTKVRFLQRLLCMMQMTSGSSVPPCGYGGPKNVGDTVLAAKPAANHILDWDDVTQNILNEATQIRYGVYRSTTVTNLVGAPPSATYRTSIITSSQYDPAGDTVAADQCMYYRFFAMDVFDQVSGN